MEDEIRHHEVLLREAMLAGDADALERLLDDCLIFVAPDGSVATKQDDLAAHRAGSHRFRRLDIEDTRIEMHGHTALVVVLAWLSVEAQGQVFEGRHRYTRTWHRGADGWRIVGGAVLAVVR